MTSPTKPRRPRTFAELLQISREKYGYTGHFAETNMGDKVFGGQLMAQALASCGALMDEPEARLSCLHATFIRPIDINPAPTYHPALLSGGRSFKHAEVHIGDPATPLFKASLSFRTTTGGPQHADQIPGAPAPEQLENLRQLAERYAERLSEGNQRVLSLDHLYEIRPVEGEDFLFCTEHQPRARYWIKSRLPLADDPRLHEGALLFMSDAWFNSASIGPHITARLSRDFMAPSLNHSLWLHRTFRADQWLLFDIESPTLANEVGVSNARIFSVNGDLVATATQQSLLRILNH